MHSPTLSASLLHRQGCLFSRKAGCCLLCLLVSVICLAREPSLWCSQPVEPFATRRQAVDIHVAARSILEWVSMAFSWHMSCTR